MNYRQNVILYTRKYKQKVSKINFRKCEFHKFLPSVIVTFNVSIFSKKKKTRIFKKTKFPSMHKTTSYRYPILKYTITISRIPKKKKKTFQT